MKKTTKLAFGFFTIVMLASLITPAIAGTPTSATAMAVITTAATSTAADATAAKEAPPALAKVADLQFLAGHWEGSVQTAKIEQTCSLADPAVMVCMFRLMSDKGTEMLEFYTLRDTPAGVEERIRFFSPDLKEEPGDGVTMKLASSSPTSLVFENPNGTYPKRSTLTRTTDDAFHSHIELVDGKGKASTIDADWKKTK
jgi:hypothetical protein